MRIAALVLVSLLVACGPNQPCSSVCEKDCELAVTCADGSSPTGDAYDVCVDDCVQFLIDNNVESEEECECSGATECGNTPNGIWVDDYEC